MTRGQRGRVVAVACACVLLVATGGHLLGRTVAAGRPDSPHMSGTPAQRPAAGAARRTTRPGGQPPATTTRGGNRRSPASSGRETRRAVAGATRPAGGGRGPAGSQTMTGSRNVALTFDDGPSWTYTPQVLDLLRAYGVKATFCMIGRMADAYPQLVQRIVREGHTLCNHTWSHDLTLGQKTDEEIRADLQRTNDALHRAVPGARVAYFRHPGGNFTPAAVRVAAEMGLRSIYWDVDPRDWSNPGTAAITSTLRAQIRPGSIVLLHDGGGDRAQTLAACQAVLAELKARFRLAALPARALA
jgi:peptidoglycan/xylan/chitin deacetylase (PgdA/CDA1 family)